MRKILKISLKFIIGILILLGCRDNNDISQEKEAIVGTWLQTEPSCTNCDTLDFFDNNTFKSNMENFKYSYEFIDESLIKIDRGNTDVNNYKYQFLNAKTTLMIEEYIPSLMGLNGDIDIVLTKIY